MKYGMISTGSKEASEAAQEILKLGGNAFDASIAAVMTSMTSEVNLTSMAGGGAMLAYKKGQKPILFDFFVDAPAVRNRKDFEFYKTEVDFGDTKQVFHIGKGSVAIPGNIKGLLHIHKRLGKIPLKVVTEPAIQIAKRGVKLSSSQAYITSLLDSIIKTSANSRELFYRNNKLLSEGDIFSNPDLSDFIEWITEEGDRPFYEGELARKIVNYLGEDGLIRIEDLKEYKVHERSPLSHELVNSRFYTNPAPSVGGTLIVFLLKMLCHIDMNYKFDYDRLVRLMAATAKARAHFYKDPNDDYQLDKLLDYNIVKKYAELSTGNIFDTYDDYDDNGLGSTTHVSILDREGNAASITTTNGESCGHVLPGTGIILNNMLGEQDLNPLGFHRWNKTKRMPTLISPSLLIDKVGKVELVIGSAGSNRIRSAILQVMSNYTLKKISLKDSIYHPRLHLEEDCLHIEPGITIDSKLINSIKTNLFTDINLFFGGVNAVTDTEAVADPRRGGMGIVC